MPKAPHYALIGTDAVFCDAQGQPLPSHPPVGADQPFLLLFDSQAFTLYHHGSEQHVLAAIAQFERVMGDLDDDLALIVLPPSSLHDDAILSLINSAVKTQGSIERVTLFLRALHGEDVDIPDLPPVPDHVFCCVDCQVNTSDLGEYYMVSDAIWAATGLDDDGGMLCIGCLESRIGRKLTPADFSDALINVMTQQSPRLRARLTGETGAAPSASTS